MKKFSLLIALFGCVAAELPHPALLVLNKEGSLAIVDPATRKVVGRVRTGDSPHEVAASEDGRFAFVSNYGDATAPGNSISIIDLVQQREAQRLDLGALRRPHGLWVAGGKLYFTCEVNKVVGRYDRPANKIDWLMGTGQNTTHMVMVKSDESQIYTANIGSNTISILDRVGRIDWNQTLVEVGKGPEGFDVTPDGKELWAAGSRDGSVTIIDLFTKSVKATIRVQTKRSNRLKFTPDGRMVLISDLAAGDLVVLARDTRKELKRLPLGREPAGILVTPDGARAYVAVTGDDNVAIVDLKSLELTGRLTTGTGPDGMAWVK